MTPEERWHELYGKLSGFASNLRLLEDNAAMSKNYIAAEKYTIQRDTLHFVLNIMDRSEQQ